ncbi:MAG: hypothetical protein ACE5R6_19190 [Candidatus Heimdallarchaeota archaeon]
MVDTLLEKMSKIEQLLLEINAKIDNFLGFEDLTEEEQEEIAQLREEIQKGDFIPFQGVFPE